MADQGWNERELVRRCKEGSEAAYAELVRQHRQRLLNLAFRLTGSRDGAEDVVQDTFIAAFRAMERFDLDRPVAPWINTICVRLAARASSRRSTGDTSLDLLLGAGAAPGDPDAPRATLAGAAADPHAAAEAAELRRDLGRALEGLPFRQRAAVVLRFVMGLDYAEAAATMEVPLNTFKSHLLRGTRELRSVLAATMAAQPVETEASGRDARARIPAVPEREPPSGLLAIEDRGNGSHPAESRARVGSASAIDRAGSVD